MLEMCGLAGCLGLQSRWDSALFWGPIQGLALKVSGSYLGGVTQTLESEEQLLRVVGSVANKPGWRSNTDYV